MALLDFSNKYTYVDEINTQASSTSSQSKICPRCNFVVDDNSSFCTSCGIKL